MRVKALPSFLLCFVAFPGVTTLSAQPAILPEALEQQVVGAFPEVAAAQAALEAAEGELAAARLLPDPVLEVGALKSRERLGAAAATRGFGAMVWEVPLPWSYGLGKAAAAAKAQEAARALARTQLAVRARVRALMVELAAAQERVEALRQQQQITEELAQLTAVRVALGGSRELERLRLSVELERAGRELQLAQAEAQAVAGVLARLAGGLPTSFRLEGRLGGRCWVLRIKTWWLGRWPRTPYWLSRKRKWRRLGPSLRWFPGSAAPRWWPAGNGARMWTPALRPFL